MSILAAIGLVVAAALVGGGAAANRDGTATLEGVPGPARVTYGKNVAYRSTFANSSASGVFTHTTFVMEAPVADGARAVFVSASCGSQVTTTNARGIQEYSCNFGTLRPADPALLVTIVWSAPDLSVGHPSCTTATPCTMVAGNQTTADTARMYWAVKERVNDQPDINDTYPAGPVVTTLLAQPDPAEAGGFQIQGVANPGACAGTTAPSLETNRTYVGNNKLSTRLCLPAFSPGLALGVASTITERDAVAGDGAGVITQVSDVCVADLGLTCPEVAAFDFGSSLLISVFQVPDAALVLKPGKITRWFHRQTHETGALDQYPMQIGCPAVDTARGCAVIGYNAKLKLWTIVTQSSVNGRWGGG